MNEVLNTLLACRNNSRLRDPLQAKIQKLKNTRICNCIVVLVCMYMDVVLYMGGWGYVYSVPIYRLLVRKESVYMRSETTSLFYLEPSVARRERSSRARKINRYIFIDLAVILRINYPYLSMNMPVFVYFYPFLRLFCSVFV